MKVMNEKELLDWIDQHNAYGNIETEELLVLFKGMMLVPTKETLLPRAKAIYPINMCARIIPEHVLVLSQITTMPLTQSEAANGLLLKFIRQFEPDYPRSHDD